MIGAKIIFGGLVVATVVAAACANDLAADLEALTGGLTGGDGARGFAGGLGEAVGAMGELLGGKKRGGDKTVIGSSTGATKHEEGFLGVKEPGELIKLLFNPFELCAKIAEFFKLSFEKFFPIVKKGFNFGFELAVQPLILSLKIIEKVFVPDDCKLKFACNLAHTFSFTKDIVPRLSDKVLNESKLYKALCDGIHSDCDSIYQCSGHPKLKEEYKEHHHGDDKHHHDEPNYSPSNILKSLKLRN